MPAAASRTAPTISADAHAGSARSSAKIAVVSEHRNTEEGEQSGDTEHADAHTGALALLGQLGLGQLDLAADQLGQLLGEPVHEPTHRLLSICVVELLMSGPYP